MISIDDLYIYDVVHRLFKERTIELLKLSYQTVSKKCKNAIFSKTKQFTAIVSIDDLSL